MQAISPSSSSTTPSPSLSFLHPVDAPDTLQLADIDPQEREDRQRAVQKLLARAEYSKLTRGLRARLAYASYKATNNLSHVPLPDLEHRIHDAPPSPAPAPAPGPPTPPRPYSPAHAHAHKRRAAMAPPVSPARSLYASLLGPPPSKRPRHVYGPAATSSTLGPAPTPADLLPSYAPTAPATPATPRKPARGSPHAHSQSHSPFVLSGHGRTVRTVLQGRARSTVTEKEDMNAAATLTALMFNRASPRAGTRTPAAAGSAGSGGAAGAEAAGEDRGYKATEDADAAELMLYLATSPSPVRPTVARRAPGSMGRVLFAGAGVGGGDEGAGAGTGTGGSSTPALTVGPSIPSSQETNAVATATTTTSPTPTPALIGSSQPSQLLPPPPSPSLGIAKTASGVPSQAAFDVSRRLFVDNTGQAGESPATQAAQTRGSAGAEADAARFGLGKGIDLVEAK